MDDAQYWAHLTKRQLQQMLREAGNSLQAAACLHHLSASQASVEQRFALSDDEEVVLDSDIEELFSEWEFCDDIETFALLAQGADMHKLSDILADTSRGTYNDVPKCTDWFEKALAWPDRDFRHEFRVSRRTFDQLVKLLEPHPIFAKKAKKPQRPVQIQLACYLMRFGKRGADALSVAHNMGVAFGTVFLYCNRVIRVLREMGLFICSWGSDERHAASKKVFGENGFHDCIGVVDGSLIRLSAQPHEQGVLYICRKKYVAINIQAVVDAFKRFISFETGWPGSVPDVTMWKKSNLWIKRHQFFKEGEYLLADKGYPSSRFLLRPFTEPEVNASGPGPEKQRKRAFNKLLSGKRIFVEHAFGMLKGRFPSLKELSTPHDIQDAYRIVESLMVLHNICIDLGDHPEAIHDYDPRDIFDGAAAEDDGAAEVGGGLPRYGGVTGEDPADIPRTETDAALRAEGYAMRLRLLNTLCPPTA